ncbi:MAG: hypothetical protein LBE32_00415 [Burkholderiales bacterium]|nr:hypothetical protein [Burkholderiales bacterium]
MSKRLQNAVDRGILRRVEANSSTGFGSPTHIGASPPEALSAAFSMVMRPGKLL